MFLMLSVEALLGEVLGLSFNTQMYGEFAKITGRSTRQVSEYFRKKKFPLGSEMKINRWLDEQGIDSLDDLPMGADIAISWRGFVAGTQNSSKDFLPQTFTLIRGLAEKDLSIVNAYKEISPDKRFDLCKTHIVKNVLPFFIEGPKESIEKIQSGGR